MYQKKSYETTNCTQNLTFMTKNTVYSFSKNNEQFNLNLPHY